LVVTLKLRVIRWRCRNAECERQTFVDLLPEIASPHARRTCRVADIVQLLGHGVGGLSGERLMNRLGMPVSDDTILRLLKLRASARGAMTTIRVAGIDDLSWRKGCTCGTIVVDLERREVVDVLPDRSTAGTAEWLSQHPEIEIISRDRGSLYAQGAREGAPQARQIADRFHLLQNLRETIETQLSRADRSTGRALLSASKDEDESEAATIHSSEGRREVAEHRRLTKQAHRRSRQAIFDQIRTLCDAGISIGDIARETGFGPQHQKMAEIQRLRSAAPRRRSLPRPVISWSIYRAAGRKAAYADESCSKRSNSSATPAASPIWSGFWRSGELQWAPKPPKLSPS
jgi:transposase